MKKLMVILVAVLLSVAIMGSALAEYGYTVLSQLPMAVDFTFDVTYDDEGLPHIVTDYPFESTGATEMNLTYNKGDIREAAVLKYTARNGETRISGYNGAMYSYDSLSNAYEDIRNGVLTLDDEVCINTTNHSLNKTDWILTYSISLKTFTDYEEMTNSQGHNAMGAGGERKLVSYKNGVLGHSYYQKRTDDGDLCIVYSQSGEVNYAYVILHRGANKGSYDYDESTGLFNGKKLSELGFEDSDINTPAPAALGDKKDPARFDSFIARCYQNILNRKASAEELNTWREGLASGQKTAAQIADQLAGSAEFKSRKLSFADMVESLYKAMLDRSSEPAEKAEWVKLLQQGQRLKAVLNGLCKSDEYISLCETSGIEPGMVYVPVIIKK